MFPAVRAVARPAAFTLLELVTVILVIAILMVMLLPVYSQILSRMEKAELHDQSAQPARRHANLYLQEHQMLAAGQRLTASSPGRWRPTGSTRSSPTA